MSELGERVDAANREAVRRMLAAVPAWTGVVRARHAIHAMGEREVCLAGPPTTWGESTELQRRAVVEAAVFEGWASGEEEAWAMAAEGGITLASSHDRGGVAAAGLGVSPSTPVLTIEDRATARRVWSGIDATGTTGSLRALEPLDERLEGRAALRDVIGPALDRAADVAGAVELVPLLARALHRGDDLGVRVEALQSLLAAELARHLVRAGLPRGELTRVLDLLAVDAALAAALAMGSARAIAAAAEGVAWSTVTTAMAQGGRSFGVRLAGLGDRWATSPLAASSLVDEDVGDRPIAECVGLGALAWPAAPALLAAFRGSRSELAERVHAMRSVTLAEDPRLTVPLLGFEGVRIGIDVRRVVETGLEPLIATVDAQIGPRGAPLAAFVEALEVFAEAVGVDATEQP